MFRLALEVVAPLGAHSFSEIGQDTGQVALSAREHVCC
jgi:hypothetical protein